MALLLKGARAIDPKAGLDETCDVLVDEGRIERIGTGLEESGAEVLDLRGKVLVPGLVDMHVHMREPGQEHKETCETAARAAAHGGFTDIVAMPNTDPVCDCGAVVEFVRSRAAKTACVNVHVAGAISKGLEGKSISEMGDMASKGAVAFTDDGRGVQDDQLMRTAFDYAKQFDMPLLSHCQRESLSALGQVNEGLASTRLGMAGWPAAAEEIQIGRDLALAELTGGKIHIQHCTTARGLELVAQAAARGVSASCELTPHHLFLCEDDIGDDYDTNLKMNPPLRTQQDMQALQQALLSGSVGGQPLDVVVATDHAPHASQEKEVEFELAPFGTTGLETALPLVLTHLLSEGKMDWARLVECMSLAPRRILGLEEVHIEQESRASLTVIDPGLKFAVTPGFFYSKACNSAFLGSALTGAASELVVDGRLVMRGGSVL